MKFATDAGARMHAMLRMVVLDDAGGDRGGAELIAKIRAGAFFHARRQNRGSPGRPLSR